VRRPATLSIISWGVVGVLAWAILAIESVGPLALAAGAQTRPGDSKQLHLTPTATCPQPDLDELTRAVNFVQAQTWTKNPDSTGFEIAPDTTACQVVLRINHLNPDERTALTTGAGPRLVIKGMRDPPRPSRLPLFLWVIFGGSGLIWLFRRTRVAPGR
jgi:hypothetical protein